MDGLVALPPPLSSLRFTFSESVVGLRLRAQKLKISLKRIFPTQLPALRLMGKANGPSQLAFVQWLQRMPFMWLTSWNKINLVKVLTNLQDLFVFNPPPPIERKLWRSIEFILVDRLQHAASYTRLEPHKSKRFCGALGVCSSVIISIL